MSEEKAFIPIEEKTVDFYGDQITAALVEVKGSKEVYVPIKPICDYLGLDWSAQFRRLKRDEVLAEAIVSIAIMATERGQGKGRRELIALPLEYLPGWLFGIDTSRIKPELKEKMLRYRRECYRALWRVFQYEVTALVADQEDPFAVEYQPKEPNPELVRIREMGLAIARLAQQQLELEQRQNRTDTRLDQAARVVGNLQKRVSRLEEINQPSSHVSEQQAATISAAVKALAELLTKQGAKGSQYQVVFNELYRRFGVADYKSIRRADYEAVLDFLDDWRRSGGGAAPLPRQTSMELPEPK